VTPEQHNKQLGIFHLIYGGLFALLVIAMMVFFGVMIASFPDKGGPPPGLFIAMFTFMFAIYGAMTVPNFIAGYALLKKKKWAKLAAIISGVMAAMSFPLGTAVCVYTFWFLFSDPGKQLYDKPVATLPQPSAKWYLDAERRDLEAQHAPPPKPTDWR
jgi:hypothetical protein